MSNSLTAWINAEDPEQHVWIERYLAKHPQDDRRGYPNGYLAHEYEPLVAWLQRQADDLAGLEMLRKMRHAWRQKQYRETHGKQLSFQLPQHLIQELVRLAKARNCSQVQALRQVISDAARHHDRADKQVRKVKQERQEALRRLEKTQQHKDAARDRIIATLLEALAEEMQRRCCLEAIVGNGDLNDLTDETRPVYDSLIETRRREIEGQLPDWTLLRLAMPTLRERVTKRDGVS